MPTCDKCGQEYDLSVTKIYSNAMTVYVDNKTGKVDGVYNGDADYINVKGRVLRKQSLKVEAMVKGNPEQKIEPVTLTTLPIHEIPDSALQANRDKDGKLVPPVTTLPEPAKIVTTGLNQPKIVNTEHKPVPNKTITPAALKLPA